MMRSPQFCFSDGQVRGFTLVELLVATGLTVMLAALLLGITNGMLTSWNQSRGQLSTSNQAKWALDQLAEDVAGAFYRADGATWFAATILDSNNSSVSVTPSALRDERGWVISGANSVRIKPSTDDAGELTFELDELEVAECRHGLAGVWLRFFTTKLDNSAADEPSAPAAVSYQIVRRQVGSDASECAYILHRSVVTPENTFSTGYDLAAGPYNTPDGNEGNPGNIKLPRKNHAIANHVIDFGVKLFVRENGALRLIFPAEPPEVGDPSTGVPSNSDNEVPAAELEHLCRSGPIDVDDPYRNRFPDVVDVMVRVLTDEGAQRIQALEAGRTQGGWWNIAEAHSQVFTRRIEVKGRGL